MYHKDCQICQMFGPPREEPPSARFWVWWNDGWVKLTLRPGQTLSHGYSGPTDEGWSSEHHNYEYDAETLCVTSHCTSDGSDCDGRLTRYYDCECRVDDLHAVPPPPLDEQAFCRRSIREFWPMRPLWKKIGSSQRDYNAEAAGY